MGYAAGMSRGALAGLAVAGCLRALMACGYEDPATQPPLISISEWPSGIAGETSGIHAVVAASSDTHLAPYATFALDDVVIDIEGATLRLSFILPVGLLGYEVAFVLEGGREQDQLVLRSAESDVVAVCEFGKTLFCEIQYGSLAVDALALESYWDQADPQAKAAHLQVAEAFAQSPTGTMDILLQR